MQSVLKRYGFDENFIHIIKTLLKNQESCVINGGKKTKYFPLQRGARQGNSVSAYFFILVLEVVFRLIKSSDRNYGLEIKELMFLYSAYADDTTFFVGDLDSASEIFKVFDTFSIYSGLKPNIEGKRNIFKALAISKIVHLAMVIDVPSDIVQILVKMQDTFLWGDKPKIKHGTLWMDYSKGDLKKCDIVSKVQSLKLSWVSRLYDESNHARKKLPKFLIHNYVGEEFQFQTNSIMHKFVLEKFTNFYKSLFQQWSI